MGKPLIDLTGQVIGYWTVLSRAPNNKRGHAQWLCRCRCGAEKVVIGIVLRDARSQSCGCLKNAALVARSVTHGQSRVGQRSLTYRIWCGLTKRCTNPNGKNFAYYSGVTICDRWSSFEAFFADMGEAPSGFTLDRIKNNLGYEPGNCRWATRTTQSRNRTITKFITFNGETKPLAEWADEVGVKYTTLYNRINRGWSIDTALTYRAAILPSSESS